MTFDALTLAAVVKELGETIVGGRLVRIAQVDSHTLLLTVMTRQDQHRLLLSVHPQFYRAHLTLRDYPQQKEGDPFTTTLNELGRNTLITSVSQFNMDRILILHLSKRSSLLHADLKMIVELTGRMSNIIMTRSEKNDIVTSWKQVDATMCRYRQILPGHPYSPPPAPPKLNPLQTNRAQFEDTLRRFNTEPIMNSLSLTVQSAGQRLTSHIIHQTGLDEDALTSSISTDDIQSLWQATITFFENVQRGTFTPLLHLDPEGQPIDFSLSHSDRTENTYVKAVESISQAIDSCYTTALETYTLEIIRSRIQTALGQRSRTWKRTLKRIEEEYHTAQQYGHERRLGELIVANMNSLRKGMSQAEVIDYFQPDQPIIPIELDPKRTPEENAKIHFRKAQKAQKAIHIYERRLKQAQSQLALLDEFVQETQKAHSEEALHLMLEKVRKAGVMIQEKRSSPSSRSKAIPFRRVTTTSGWTVLIGRNKKENDWLTFHFAAQNDIWLHARGVSGSHVLLRREGRKDGPDPKTLEEAAMLAAYFSKARSSAVVPVSYTERRYVRKPKGAPPGLVIIEREKTILVEPKFLKSSNAGQKNTKS
jgi:predicted ribosome quality control (RQC) complex YloA/Tae2 family protein